MSSKIVGGAAIGAQRDGNAPAQHLGHRRDAAAQLHVALGIVDGDHSALLEQIQVLVGHVDTVDGGQPLVDQTKTVQVGEGGRVVPSRDLFHLVASLGYVDLHVQAQAVPLLARPMEQFGAGREGRRGRQHELDTRAASRDLVPALDILQGLLLNVADRQQEFGMDPLVD